MFSLHNHPFTLWIWGVLLLPVLVAGKPARAETPVIPGSAEIAGYIRLHDPRGLSESISHALAWAGVSRSRFQIMALLGAPSGDPNFGMVERDEVLTRVWIQDASGSATPPDRKMSLMTVLPAIRDQELLTRCAAAAEMKSATVGGLSFIGPPDVIQRVNGWLPDLKAIQNAEQRCDVVAFFRESMWGDATGRLPRQGQGARLSDAVGALARLGGIAESEITSRTEQMPPCPSFPFRMACQALKDVKAVHLRLDINEFPLRLAVNLDAKSGTPLERFCKQSPGAANHFSRFLPPDGTIRASLSLEPSTLRALAVDLAKRAAAEAAIAPAQAPPAGGQADRTVQWIERRLFVLDRAAVCLRGTERGKIDSFVAVLKPENPDTALQIVKELLEESPGGSQQAATPVASREVEVAAKNAEYEGFPIDQFFAKAPRPRGGPSVPTGPSPMGRFTHNAVLSACFAGSDLVLASRYQDLVDTMGRVLQMNALDQPLAAQSAFLDGAHLYADVRSAEAALRPWSESSALSVAGRVADGGDAGCFGVQLAVSIPAEAIRDFFPPKARPPLPSGRPQP